MPIALLAQDKGNGNDGFTSPGVDTTGASLLVVSYAYANATPTLSDSNGNTWGTARLYAPFGPASTLRYAWNPTVGAGHTFTLTGTDCFASGQLSAFSGVDTSADPFDQSNEGLSFGSTSVTLGSVTPTTDGQLVIAHWNYDNATGLPTVDGGFTSPAYGDLGVGAVYNGSAVTYLIQTTAAAAAPTMTKTGSGSNNYATIATFKAAAGGTDHTQSPVDPVGVTDTADVFNALTLIDHIDYEILIA
jgi:hypothetical protein